MKIPQNTFKQALRNGQQQYGFWLGLANPLSAELCAYTGYDWLLIDGEHAPNNLQTILAQLQAISGTSSHPVVRVVEGDTALIKQMLDIGAQTLLVPMVETAEQAAQLVKAMHYPPNGVRGVGSALARASGWNQITGYFAAVDEQLCLLIQIESVTGLNNLDEILKVDGIDGVFIGPADLAGSMGYLGQPAHPEVKAAVTTATQKIIAAGKAVGTLATNKAIATAYEQAGMQFIALGVDTLVLATTASSILKNHLSKDDKQEPNNSGNGAY
ncbi:4-hydroxy-2-oxoheptanedioate aldolase [Pseudomaricurvus alcaniphilus]|uniref:4-hydroxy-2-oxoheptanedioate aldolase n=1 Tax=Pseudomaricurvus alcaniphilus TaxID=1166482 RepID=UPI001409235D|nr:4-hydroxy-2-oxoheptanedioate aldolase [Pseudomaricurvus alcaniphilus]NHN39880.1 4-hydroxy-2-oxoheptanedioate aldolase [Pseudomaricurvus alcaniphilus]